MKTSEQDQTDKKAELQRYRDLVLATLDYQINNKEFRIQNNDFDSNEHWKGLKIQTEDHYQKGRLTLLKNWFRDLTEGHVENGDLKFNQYLQEKTKYDIDIFRAFFKRIEQVISKGRITSDSQYYDVNTMVDQLCQVEPIDNKKIEIMNMLLRDYEQKKSKPKARSNNEASI